MKGHNYNLRENEYKFLKGWAAVLDAAEKIKEITGGKIEFSYGLTINTDTSNDECVKSKMRITNGVIDMCSDITSKFNIDCVVSYTDKNLPL